jgi:hypothetical protein
MDWYSSISDTSQRGVSHGRTEGTSSTTTDTTSETLGYGISVARTESLQVRMVNYGIDLGIDPAEHVRQWRVANRDPATVYENVHALFKTMCQQMIGELEIEAKGLGGRSPAAMEDKLTILRNVIVVEQPVRALPAPRP